MEDDSTTRDLQEEQPLSAEDGDPGDRKEERVPLLSMEDTIPSQEEHVPPPQEQQRTEAEAALGEDDAGEEDVFTAIEKLNQVCTNALDRSLDRRSAHDGETNSEPPPLDRQEDSPTGINDGDNGAVETPTLSKELEEVQEMSIENTASATVEDPTNSMPTETETTKRQEHAVMEGANDEPIVSVADPVPLETSSNENETVGMGTQESQAPGELSPTHGQLEEEVAKKNGEETENTDPNGVPQPTVQAPPKEQQPPPSDQSSSPPNSEITVKQESSPVTGNNTDDAKADNAASTTFASTSPTSTANCNDAAPRLNLSGSNHASISPLDDMYVQQTKQKQEARQKERETREQYQAKADATISPLDQMYMQQNQQKNEARQREKETKQQYQANVDTAISPLDQMYLQQNQQKNEAREKERQTKQQYQQYSDKGHFMTPLDQLYFQQNQQKNEARQKERETKQQYHRHSEKMNAISPLDQMYLQQNQQKNAARQKERETIEHYQRRSSSDRAMTVAISPLDQMYLKQNQQKNAARQKARDTLQQYQRHSAFALTSNSSTGNNDAVNDNSDAASEPDLISTSPKQKSMSQKEELDALRQQGLAKKTEQSFVTTTQARDKPSTSDELEALRQKGLASTTNKLYEDNQLQRRSSNEKPTAQQELEALRQSGLAKSAGKSYQESSARRSSAPDLAELEVLRQQGLAKALSTQYTENVKKTERETDEYVQQQRDLEQRKSKTSEYIPSGNGELSLTDAQRLSHNKRKIEDREKDRETLGFYKEWRPAMGEKPDRAARAVPPSGHVITTTGQSNANSCVAAVGTAAGGGSIPAEEKGAFPGSKSPEPEAATCACACTIS